MEENKAYHTELIKHSLECITKDILIHGKGLHGALQTYCKAPFFCLFRFDQLPIPPKSKHVCQLLCMEDIWKELMPEFDNEFVDKFKVNIDKHSCVDHLHCVAFKGLTVYRTSDLKFVLIM